MEFVSLEDAERKGLVPLTVWLEDNDHERYFIQKELKRFREKDNGRVIKVVKLGKMLALYVNDVTDGRY